MYFAKAIDLVRLAQIAAVRHGGISLEEIADEFGVSHRTAQRMTDALETTFLGVEILDNAPDRKRRWRLPAGATSRLAARLDAAVEALEIAERDAQRTGRGTHSVAPANLRDQILSALPRPTARRAEADAEALLASIGAVARPGPHSRIDAAIAETIYDALRGPSRLRLRYDSDPLMERLVEPLGVLLGQRSYLVAIQPDRGPEYRHFRLDRIVAAEVTTDGFAVPDDFDIETHASRSFGAWQDPSQYGEVVWRFAPRAVQVATEFEFHPSQLLELQPDGGLIVRFKASGWLEMAWHLYQWGDAVEVLAPEPLRRMVENHRRSDFGILP